MRTQEALSRRLQLGPAAGEAGAAAVETALILPIVVTLLFAMISGGLLLFQSITLSDAVREATRYAATLPVETTTSDWLDAVVQRTVDSANGQLDSSHGDRSICVALVGLAEGGRWDDGVVTTGAAQECVSDGRPSDEPRVQVVASREGEFVTVVWSRTVTLDAQAVGRYEVSD